MKISFEGQAICSNYKTGIGWYTYNLIKNIIETGQEDQFDINIFDFLGRNRAHEKVNVLFHGYNTLKVNKCTWFHNGVYIRNQDLLSFISYNHLFNINVQVSHFFNYFIPKNIKSKTVVTIYDMVYKLYPETMYKANYDLLNKNTQRSGRDADIILTISENSKKEIAELINIPLEKIRIAYPATDSSIFYPRKDESCKSLLQAKYKIEGDYILYLGTLEPRKNINTLIKAFELVSIKNSDIKLVLAGGKGWKYDEIYSLVQELKLEDRVTFTGYIEEEDIPILYSNAIMFVFPSIYEGFGMPPLEAMACGTPVIVSNSSSLPEVVGDSGVLVDPRDSEHIACEIERLIHDKNLRKDLADKGLLQASKFSWKQSANKAMDIYRSLI